MAEEPSRTAAPRSDDLIVVVDDESAIRHLVQDTLKDEGYPVATASDGQAALALLDSVHPALILLDLHMPKMDGFEVIKEYHRRTSNPAPVIIVSALRPQGDLPAGVFSYVGKPFDLDELLVQVEHAFEWARSESYSHA